MSPDPMTRLNAALEGRYQIERELGEGGMATVYLAKDVKHNRRVALKVLKPELAAVVGAERFLAEIETTANLQHPHILALFDSGEADSFLFYVMPYVEGETLRDRLDREHQLPVEDAVEIAKNLAEALDYAHGKGVIHRDIKPANILLQAGKPVIADFGIALAVGVAGGGRLTETGLSMGTPHYMSPEQATGDSQVGAATDLYALGCVVYEMLVGEPPYTGTTAQAVLGKILAGELASASKHRASVPAHVESVIRKALEKLPADRFTGAAVFARALADPGFRHGEDASARGPVVVGSWNHLTVILGALFVVASAVAIWALVRPQPRPIARFEVTLGEGRGLRRGLGVSGPPRVALARDDSRIVYLGSGPDGEGRQLWRREFDDLEPQPIPGTERAIGFALSPGGRSVVFYDPTGIKTVSLEGGPPSDLDAQGGRFPAWGPDGMIYYGREGILYRVPERGGEHEAVTTPKEGQVHGNPHVLPDGAGVLVTLVGDTRGGLRIGVVGPGGGEVREILEATRAQYVASGHIVYSTADGALRAVPFDLERLETTGSPSTLLAFGTESTAWSLSDQGTLVYAIPGMRGESELVWVSRSGAVEPVDPTWTGRFGFPALSPDGTKLAVDVTFEGRADIWVHDLDSGRRARLTLEGATNDHPTWTPDGDTVTFVSTRAADGGRDVWSKPADGGLAELKLDRERDVYQILWSPGQESLIYRTDSNARGRADILAWRPGQDTVPLGLLESDFGERQPALSPDGRWLAYVSEETGSYEVQVVPFPVTDDGRRWPISTNGGTEPLWSRGGDEIFYRDGQGDMIAVQVETTPTFSVVRSEVLFSAEGFRNTFIAPKYDVSHDDRRFLMIRAIDGGTGNEDINLVVVQNFFEVMKARMRN